MSFCLHAWNINQDLPFHYNSDEPHNLHVAAHFSTGDLNPHDFKYPTLWPYTIAILLGIIFVIFRFLGITGSAHEFGVLFFTSPTPIYLATRLLAAALISFVPIILYLIGRKHFSKPSAVAIGLFASFCPMVVTYGRTATPYSLLLFLVAVTYYFFHEYAFNQSRKSIILSGFFLGLAVSTHYLASTLAWTLIGLFFLLPKEMRTWKNFMLGFGAAFGGFVLASPFVILDFPAFYQIFKSLNTLQSPEGVQFSISSNIFVILKNMVQFIDPYGIGFSMSILGLFVFKKYRKAQLFVLFLPFLILTPYLFRSYFGSAPRYSYCILFPFLFTAAGGFDYIWNKVHKWKLGRLSLCFIFFPSLLWAFNYSKGLNIRDTRTLTRNWIETNIPPGSAVLLYAQYHTAPLDMHIDQVKTLLEKTKSIQHPRQSYYQLLLDGRPKGGYKIYYMRRSNFEVMDVPERTEKSYLGLPSIDTKKLSISELINTGVEFVVLDDAFEKLNRESTWLTELKSNYSPIFETSPITGKIKGPPISVYNIQN